jgi:hypothetical protein
MQASKEIDFESIVSSWEAEKGGITHMPRIRKEKNDCLATFTYFLRSTSP